MPRISVDRWRVLSPYLDEALDVVPAERAAWLAHVCAHDASLATDLRRMLAELDLVREARFLERACRFPSTCSDVSR